MYYEAVWYFYILEGGFFIVFVEHIRYLLIIADHRFIFSDIDFIPNCN